MDRRQFSIAALAAVVAAAATPAMAKLYYNPDTNRWEDRVVTAHGHGKYSPIVRETVVL